jgi:hypothetical protein
VLQYQPSRFRTAVSSDRAQCDSAPSRRSSDHGQLLYAAGAACPCCHASSTRHRLQLHVSEASSRRRAVASCMRQPFGRPPPNGRCRPPAAVTAPRAARVPLPRTLPSPRVRGKKAIFCLFPLLPSTSHPPLELTIAVVPRPPSTAASGPPPATPSPPRAPPESLGPLRPLQRQT